MRWRGPEVLRNLARRPAECRFPLGLRCPRPRPAAKGALRCSRHGAAAMTPHRAWTARCIEPSRSVHGCAVDFPRAAALLGASNIAPAETGIQPGMVGGGAERLNFSVAEAPGWHRQGTGRRWGDVGSAEARRLCGSERSEPRELTRWRLSERSERSERSEFDSGHGAEHRREPSAQPRARTNEPLRTPAHARPQT